jgi:hypothetical protein
MANQVSQNVNTRLPPFLYWNRIAKAAQCCLLALMDEGGIDEVHHLYQAIRPFLSINVRYNHLKFRKYVCYAAHQIIYDARGHPDFVRWARKFLERYMKYWPVAAAKK